MQHAAALAPLLALVVAFQVFCVVEVFRHDAKLLPRWAWVIVILVVSAPVGGILYLVVGMGERPESGAAGGAGSARAAPPVVARTGAREARAPSSTASGPPIVQTRGLTKRYPDHVALDAIDLAVHRGSVFGVVGTNGAGKTTLLSLLSGLRAPSAGTIDVAVDRMGIGVMPDTPWFDPWLTAREVVDLARVLVDPSVDPGRVDEALAAVGLTDAAGRRVGGFSRGMLQRLGLAATVVTDPELILLDEPCASLDPLGRRDLLDLIARLGDEATVLFCSHILDDVQEVCDTVVVLRDGHKLYEGTLADLLVGEAAPGFVVRVRPPLEPVEEALRAAPWVHTIHREGREALRVVATSLDDAEAGLARVLADAGAHVVSVEPASGDLEQVFLQLMGREAAPAAEERS